MTDVLRQLSGLSAAVPLVIVTLAGLAALVAEAFREKDERMPMAALAMIGLVGSGVATVLLWNREARSFGVVTADNFALFINLVLVVCGFLTVLISEPILERDRLPAGEYYCLLLFAIGGMMLMASTTDLLVLFLALEVFSISVYVLTGFHRRRDRSVEGAFKYFVLGAFASVFLLYGAAFAYGAAGSTKLDRIGQALAGSSIRENPLMLLAAAMLLVGLAFKVSAVPFHMWTPDAYEGAPTVVTGFMSTAVKAAAFGAFARVFLSALEPLRASWTPLLWTIAAATMILGSVAGVVQTNVKRMLAYSSIAHGGYLLVAIVSANEVGKASILFYLLSYAVTNIGAFGVIALLGDKDGGGETLSDFAGLWYSRPGLSALMTVFLLSLGGFPPTAGFIAKWYIFSAAVRQEMYGLAIIGVLTSVVSVFFYLKIIIMMYMTEAPREVSPPALSRLGMAALVIATIAVFYLGILPTQALDLAAHSISTIF